MGKRRTAPSEGLSFNHLTRFLLNKSKATAASLSRNFRLNKRCWDKKKGTGHHTKVYFFKKKTQLSGKILLGTQEAELEQGGGCHSGWFHYKLLEEQQQNLPHTLWSIQAQSHSTTGQGLLSETPQGTYQ